LTEKAGGAGEALGSWGSFLKLLEALGSRGGYETLVKVMCC